MRGRVRTRARLVAGAVALAWLAVTAGASATMMVEIPLTDLAKAADAVVQARVTRVGHFLAVEDGHLTPLVGVDLRVDTWLRGQGPSDIQLRERGGTLPDGSTLRILGAPEYREGERVVVFLRRREANAWRTLEMVQGKFAVVESAPGAPAMLRRDLREVTLLNSTGEPHHGVRQEVPMTTVLQAIRGVTGTGDPRGALTR